MCWRFEVAARRVTKRCSFSACGLRQDWKRFLVLGLSVLALVATCSILASSSVLHRYPSTHFSNEKCTNQRPCASVEKHGHGSVQEVQSVALNGCSWQLCPERFGLNRQDKDVKRVALLVSGQLSRLELRSKLKNLILENYLHSELYAVFLLQHGEKRASNYHERADGPHDTEEWSDMEALHDHVASMFTSLGWQTSPLHQEVSYSGGWYHGDKLTRQVFYFALLEKGRVVLRVAFGLTHDEPNGALLLNSQFAPTRGEQQKQQNQQSMFRNMRKTMMLLEDIEIRIGTFMDYIFRIREDVFILRPFKFPNELSKSVFVTPNCWTAGGFSDWSYIVGRDVASKLMRGFAEDYYLRIESHYKNPEHFVKYLALFHKAHVVKRSVCEWPMLPVIFFMRDGVMNMRLRTESRLSAIGECSIKAGNDTCFWRNSKEIVKGVRKPYSPDEFVTWV